MEDQGPRKSTQSLLKRVAIESKSQKGKQKIPSQPRDRQTTQTEMPNAPPIRRLVPNTLRHCNHNHVGSDDKEECFELRCCDHRGDSDARAVVHEDVCPNMSHDPEEISINENSIASELEPEILVDSSESGSEQDWDMEDSDANNESLSTYDQSYAEAGERDEGEVSPQEEPSPCIRNKRVKPITTQRRMLEPIHCTKGTQVKRLDGSCLIKDPGLGQDLRRVLG